MGDVLLVEEEGSGISDDSLGSNIHTVESTDFRPVIKVLSGQELSNLPVEYLDALVSTYIEIFGDKPWNEGAISPTGEVISLAAYRALDEQVAAQYKPYYESEQLRYRFQAEFSSDTQTPFLITLEQGSAILGMSWGACASLDPILSRIGNANYSHNRRAEQAWTASVSYDLKERLLRVFSEETADIYYIDEILVGPQARGRNSVGVFEKLMRTILALRSEQEESANQPLRVFFRTSLSPESEMGKMARRIFVGSGLFEEIVVEDDLEDIGYFAANISSGDLEEMSKSESVFRYMLQRAKSRSKADSVV